MFSHNQQYTLLLNWPCLSSSRELILRISNLVFADWKRAENDLQRYSGCTGQAPDPHCIIGRVQGFLLQDVSFCPEDEEDAHLCSTLTATAKFFVYEDFQVLLSISKDEKIQTKYQHLSNNNQCFGRSVSDVTDALCVCVCVSQEGRLPQVPGRVCYRKRQEGGGGEQSDGVQSC